MFDVWGRIFEIRRQNLKIMSFREVRTWRGGGGGLGTSGRFWHQCREKTNKVATCHHKNTLVVVSSCTLQQFYGVKNSYFFDVFGHVQNSIVSSNNL